jgi:hypothetical protein
VGEPIYTWLAVRALRWICWLGFFAYSFGFIMDRKSHFNALGSLLGTTEAAMFGFALVALFSGFIELGLRERAGLQRPRFGQLIPPKATAAMPEPSR